MNQQNCTFFDLCFNYIWSFPKIICITYISLGYYLWYDLFIIRLGDWTELEHYLFGNWAWPTGLQLGQSEGGTCWQIGGCACGRCLEGEVSWQATWGKRRSQLQGRGHSPADCPHRQSVQQLETSFPSLMGEVSPHTMALYLFISVKDSLFLLIILTNAPSSDVLC